MVIVGNIVDIQLYYKLLFYTWYNKKATIVVTIVAFFVF